ncbi:hypothetical protein Tco_1383663 [Tanacetum coccineum]
MSTQQDIYVVGSRNHPPMLNKDNYISWSSRLLRYAKSKSNGKLLLKSILEGPYKYRMITPHVLPFSHLQTDDELTTQESKQAEADDQGNQIILMGLSEDIYAAVDSCQEIHIQIVGGNGRNQFRQYSWKNTRIQIRHNARNHIGYNAGQNAGNQIGQNEGHNQGIQNVGNQNGLIIFLAVGNQNGNSATAGRAKWRKRTNLHQASTLGTHVNTAPIYDSDGSAEIHQYENCCNNEIFNMFSQEEQYIELLQPINDTYTEQQTDNNIIFEALNMDPNGGEVEHHHVTIKETCNLDESLYNSLVIEVEKVNTVNRETIEANEKMTAKLARCYRNLFMVRRLGLFQAYDGEFKVAHQLRLEFHGNRTLTLCYPKNDREDNGKLGAKGDICFSIGYYTTSCAYRVYNRRTKKVMEMMNITFDELSTMTFEHRISKPALQDAIIAPAAPATLNCQTPNTYTTTAKTAPTPTHSSTMAPVIPNTSMMLKSYNNNNNILSIN